MRAVIDLDDDRFVDRHRRAVHIAFRIAVERAGREHDTGPGVLVTALEAEHELVGGVRVALRDPGPTFETDQGDRGAGLVVAPQHLLRQPGQGLLGPLLFTIRRMAAFENPCDWTLGDLWLLVHAIPSALFG